VSGFELANTAMKGLHSTHLLDAALRAPADDFPRAHNHPVVQAWSTNTSDQVGNVLAGIDPCIALEAVSFATKVLFWLACWVQR